MPVRQRCARSIWSLSCRPTLNAARHGDQAFWKRPKKCSNLVWSSVCVRTWNIGRTCSRFLAMVNSSRIEPALDMRSRAIDSTSFIWILNNDSRCLSLVISERNRSDVDGEHDEMIFLTLFGSHCSGGIRSTANSGDFEFNFFVFNFIVDFREKLFWKISTVVDSTIHFDVLFFGHLLLHLGIHETIRDDGHRTRETYIFTVQISC